ncbi:WCX domain-containing protein [Modestobacter caceresii]
MRVHASAVTVQYWIDPAWGHIEAIDDTTCVLHVGADSLASIARWLLLLDAELTPLHPPALADEFAALAARATRAAHGTETAPNP